MDEHRIALLAILGVAAVILVYQAQSMTEDQPIPIAQGELQMMGVALGAGIRYNSGTCLDMNPCAHFWSPETNPRDFAPNGFINTPHRYPVVPGGNMSTVMHKGWGSFTKDSPMGNDWRIAPPEAAVL